MKRRIQNILLLLFIACYSCGSSEVEINKPKQSIQIKNDSIKDYSVVIGSSFEGQPLTHLLKVNDFRWKEHFKRNTSILYCEKGRIMYSERKIDSVVVESLKDARFDGYIFVIDYTFPKPFAKSQIKNLEHYKHLTTYSYLKNDNLFTFFAYEYNLKND